MKEPNMLLITSEWGNPAKPTFRMIPTTLECPFQEAIFDPGSKVLAIISKVPMQKHVMTYKIDDNGDPMMLKGGAKRPNGKTYKEERRLMESYQEYYIEDPTEVKEFIKRFAINYIEVEGKGHWPDIVNRMLEKKEVPPGEITLGTELAAVSEDAGKVERVD